ncbi:hypothetical protein JTB14_002096 [Gonioctena quinquepunctata]|nr:hypothetical protein JTB14_002096 [Gonioctena quinquepunctata]
MEVSTNIMVKMMLCFIVLLIGHSCAGTSCVSNNLSPEDEPAAGIELITFLEKLDLYTGLGNSNFSVKVDSCPIENCVVNANGDAIWQARSYFYTKFMMHGVEKVAKRKTLDGCLCYSQHQKDFESCMTEVRTRMTEGRTPLVLSQVDFSIWDAIDDFTLVNFFDLRVKMNETSRPIHLLFEELNNELAIRGVLTNKPQDERKKNSARFIDREKNSPGSTIILSLYSFDSTTEKSAIDTTLNSIEAETDEFEGSSSDSSFKILSTLQDNDTVQDLIKSCKRLEEANYVKNKSSNKPDNFADVCSPQGHPNVAAVHPGTSRSIFPSNKFSSNNFENIRKFNKINSFGTNSETNQRKEVTSSNSNNHNSNNKEQGPSGNVSCSTKNCSKYSENQ